MLARLAVGFEQARRMPARSAACAKLSYGSGVLPIAQLDEIIDRALAEDLPGEDLTSALTVDPSTRARAVAVARARLVVCGGAVFARVFERVEPSARVTTKTAE